MFCDRNRVGIVSNYFLDSSSIIEGNNTDIPDRTDPLSFEDRYIIFISFGKIFFRVCK
jgi:hypothetical protein